MLFPSNAKYNSGTGWPSFWRTAQTNAVAYHREWDGRLECRCAKCQSHLGHVFLDGPYPSSITNQELVQSIPSTDPKSSSSSKNECLPRFCVNGLALTYQKDQSSTLSSSTVSKWYFCRLRNGTTANWNTKQYVPRINTLLLFSVGCRSIYNTVCT